MTGRDEPTTAEDSTERFSAPEDLVVASNDRLVELMTEAELSPESEMADQEWESLCRRIREREKRDERRG